VEPFTVLTGAGIVLGLVQVARYAPQDEIVEWLDAALFTLFGALVGARLYFVVLHLEYFRGHIWEAPQFWLGGLDWPGAIIGGYLGMLGISAIRNYDVRQAADRLAHLIPPLAIAAWLGCGSAGCGYSTSTTLSSLQTPEVASFTPGFPVEILAATILLCYYAFLELAVTRPLRTGRRAGLIGLGLAVNLLAFSFLRVDPSPAWFGQRPDMWAAFVFTIFMLASCLFPRKKDVFSFEI
jgi:phosphatidylglycerol---prolipoprotein diacylglyceryl transferase